MLKLSNLNILAAGSFYHLDTSAITVYARAMKYPDVLRHLPGTKLCGDMSC